MSRRPGLWIVCIVIGIFLSLLLHYDSSAQWGGVQKGIDTLQKGKEATTPTTPGAPAPGKSGGSTAPATYKNTARGFSYTIPAGWEKIEGDPNSEAVGFKKSGTSWGFSIHMNQMTPSFPRKSAVDAGLKQDKERISIKQVLEAKRRDAGDQKKKCGVIGWEQTEAPQKNGIQRIIWQSYDGDNYYMNIMAFSSNEDFAAAKATLREIMDSIKFCQ